MPHSHDERFLGAMPPAMFLERFMQATGPQPATPKADFSGVPITDSVQAMCKYIIRTVGRLNLCPGIRLFEARTTRERARRELPDAQPSHRSATGERSQWLHPCPAMAARVRPKVRRGVKRKQDVVEYYDFATALLDIEVDHRPQADPFIDPEHTLSSRRASSGSDDDRSGSSISTSDSAQDQHEPRRGTPRLRTEDAELSPVSQPPPGRNGEPQPLATSSRCAFQSNNPGQHAKSSSASSLSSYFDPIENNSPEGTAFRSSLCAHATAQFSRQHRRFLLQLVIVHRWARFIRWDRSGAVVTERFDYISHPNLLGEFLFRFAHLDDEGRGFDTTATLASKSELALFRRAVQEFLDAMNARNKNGHIMRRLPNVERTLDDTGTYPTWALQVANETTKESTRLIVNRPFTGEPSLFGRATRAYIAYDVQAGRLVFLKDTWRICSSQLRAEFKTYQHLHTHGVPNIPEVWYGGDVLDGGGKPQETITHVLAAEDSDWRVIDGAFPKHMHHRIVQDIAYPIASALDEREFLQAMCDAITAVAQAYDLTGLLHRDLSYSNIMIKPDGRGILNDWDHAGRKNAKTRRVGTWQFMSISLLENPRKVHDMVDDLESLFWVFLYALFKQFTLPKQSLPMDIFDYQTVDRTNRRVGGKLKLSAIQHDDFLQLGYTSDVLKNLLTKSNLAWQDYHTGLRNAHRLDDDDRLRIKLMSAMELAKKPSFWVETFTSALRCYDECARRKLQVGRGATDSDGMAGIRRVDKSCVEIGGSTYLFCDPSGDMSCKRQTHSRFEHSSNLASDRSASARSKRLRRGC